METITQDPQLLTEMQSGKRNAMQEAFNKIEEASGIGTGSKHRVEVARQLLAEIATDSSLSRKETYRMEQAIAKLIEYYQMETEVEIRRREIVSILPEASLLLAANDENFIQVSDEKYSVAL